MAYQPSLDDIPAQSYQPSLSDISTDTDNSSSDQDQYSQFMASIGKPTTTQTSNIGRGMAAGLLELGRGIANLLPHAEDALGVSRTYQPLTQQDIGTTKVLPPDVANTDEANAGFLTSQLLAGAATPMGEMTDIGTLMKAGKVFLTGEALSPVYSPDQPIPESLKKGLAPSAIGASLEPALKGLKAIPQGLMTMGGTATPEEFAKNVSAVGDIPVGTPELSRSPSGTKFEQNMLSNLPFSGVKTNNMAVGKALDDKVNGVLTNLNVVPESPDIWINQTDPTTGQISQMAVKKETQQEKIAQNFRDNVSKNEQIKNQLYSTRDAVAQQTPGNFTANLRKQTADKQLAAIKAEKDEKGFTNVSRATLKELKAASSNNPISFKRLNFNRQTYNDMADQFAQSGNFYESRIMKNLGSSYNQDIKNAISQTGNEELAAAQKAADDHFKDKIAPIRNDDKLLAQSKENTANPNQFLSDVISKGRYDDPTTLDVVMKNLDPDYRKQFTHEYLTQGSKEILGTDELGSDKVLSTYGKLGDETKRIMFSPQDRQTLDSSYKTRQLMGQSVQEMANPKTGYSHGLAIGSTASAGMTAALASKLMGIGMNAPEAYMTAFGALSGTGNALAKYLTSQTSRNLYSKGAQLRELDIRSPVNIGLLMQSNQDHQ